MEEYIGILKNTKIFSGVNGDELKAMLGCLCAKTKRYGKGEYVLFRGEELEKIPILVEGKLHIQNEDYWGNRSILGNISVGEMFGEAYAVPESGPMLNDVVAVEESTVMFLDVKKLMTTCSSGCRFHSLVIRNLFYEISDKNRKLVQKLNHMSKRSTREKLISYLSEEAERQKNAAFEIPFNRQQLADFLSVDRSAMSAELCKMRDEGMIKFQKNRFELL